MKKKEIKIIKPAKTKNDLMQNYIEEIKADFNNYNNSLWMKQGSLKKYTFEQYIDVHFHIWISNIEMTPEVEKEAYENYKKITNQMFGDKTTEHLYFWKNYEIWKENQIEKEKRQQKKLEEQKKREERKALKEQKQSVKREYERKTTIYLENYKFYKNDILWQYYNSLKPIILKHVKKAFKYRTEEQYNEIANSDIVFRYKKTLVDIADKLHFEQIKEMNIKLANNGIVNGIISSNNYKVKITTIIAGGEVQIDHYRVLVKNI